MDALDWMAGLSRRLRVAALALVLALGLKTTATLFVVQEAPSASVQIETRSFEATRNNPIHRP